MRAVYFAIVATMAGSSVAGAATLLHHYDFQTDGTVNDLAGGQSGALLNGASVTGGMLHLDGNDDHVQFSTHLVPTTGQYSVALFARQLSASGITELISQGFSGGPGFYIGHNGAQFRLSDAWLSTSVNFPADGNLHHYAFVVDASQSRLYIDGAPAATLPTPISTTSGGTATRLGRQFGGYSEFFHGQLDDVRIYSGALTGGEVYAIAVPEPTTVGSLLTAGILLARRVRPK